MNNFRRHFSRIISYLIIFELILINTNFPVFLAYAQQGQNCPSGLVWNSDFGMCKTPQQIAEANAASHHCLQISDPQRRRECQKDAAKSVLDGSKEIKRGATRDCILKDEKCVTDKVWWHISYSAPGVVLPAVYLLKKGKQVNKSVRNSLYFIMAATGIFVGAEIYLTKKLGKELNQMKEDYEVRGIVEGSKFSGTSSSSTTSSSSSTSTTGSSAEVPTLEEGNQMQHLAYDYMIAKEKKIKEAAAWKERSYYAASGLYAIAAALCIKEMIESATKVKSSRNIDRMKNEYKNIFNQNYLKALYSLNKFSLMSSAYAQPSTPIVNLKPLPKKFNLPPRNSTFNPNTTINPPNTSGAGLHLNSPSVQQHLKNQGIDTTIPNKPAANSRSGGGSSGNLGEGFDKFMESPWTRLILALGGAGYTTTKGVQNSKDKNICDDHITILENSRPKTDGSGGVAECLTHDDPNNSACFCYNNDGSKNLTRASSPLCEKLFGNNNVAGKSNYDNPDSAVGIRGCVDSQLQFDQMCKCRGSSPNGKQTGKNTCFKTNVMNSNFSGIGGAQWLGGVDQGISQFANGNLDQANLDKLNNANNNAFKNVNALLKKLEKDPKFSKKVKALPALTDKFNKHFDGYRSSVAGAGGSAGALAANAPFSSFGDRNYQNLKGKDLLQKVKEDLKIRTFETDGGGQAATGSENEGDNWNMNLGGETGIHSGQLETAKMDEVMKNEYDIGDGDIHQRADDNLFDILSQRYKNSGMKKIFD